MNQSWNPADGFSIAILHATLNYFQTNMKNTSVQLYIKKIASSIFLLDTSQ